MSGADRGSGHAGPVNERELLDDPSTSFDAGSRRRSMCRAAVRDDARDRDRLGRPSHVRCCYVASTTRARVLHEPHLAEGVGVLAGRTRGREVVCMVELGGRSRRGLGRAGRRGRVGGVLANAAEGKPSSPPGHCGSRSHREPERRRQPVRRPPSARRGRRRPWRPLFWAGQPVVNRTRRSSAPPRGAAGDHRGVETRTAEGWTGRARARGVGRTVPRPTARRSAPSVYTPSAFRA